MFTGPRGIEAHTLDPKDRMLRQIWLSAALCGALDNKVVVGVGTDWEFLIDPGYGATPIFKAAWTFVRRHGLVQETDPTVQVGADAGFRATDSQMAEIFEFPEFAVLSAVYPEWCRVAGAPLGEALVGRDPSSLDAADVEPARARRRKI